MSPVISFNKDTLSAQQATIFNDYLKVPLARKALRARSKLITQVLEQLWQTYVNHSDFCLLATGGYARKELYPYSDIDLMILTDTEPSVQEQAKLDKFQHHLWDLGLQIGISTRPLKQALDLSLQDITIQTNLLESQFIQGKHALFEQFTHQFRAQLSIHDFYQAKLIEQQQRHQRHQNSPYALEPNCKESPGGLRDLHLLSWMAQASDWGNNWHALITHRLLTATETRSLLNCERFLQHIRIRLQLLAKRNENRLLFDHQISIAQSLYPHLTDKRQACEKLMQNYYQQAKSLFLINHILMKSYINYLGIQPVPSIQVDNTPFYIENNHLDIQDPLLFQKKPICIFQTFLYWQKDSQIQGISARLLRSLGDSYQFIDETFRHQAENKVAFLAILQSPHRLTQCLALMNDCGILQCYLPAWHKIVGQLQHDLFHIYTVDQHTLTVLSLLERFTLSAYAHEYPLMTRLMHNLKKQWLLYLAALFHDIGKGQGGHHEEIGRIALSNFCQEHALSTEDSELCCWLVENHLLMSITAQRKDITDPNVIQQFTQAVGSIARLNALYLLTHADIRGTSPKIWHSWRAQLLENLYHYAIQAFDESNPNNPSLNLSLREQKAQQLLLQKGFTQEQISDFWQKLDSSYLLRHSAEHLAWQASEILGSPQKNLIKVRKILAQDAMEVLIYTPDKPNLFMHLTGWFDHFKLDILDAKIHTTQDHYALDSFIVKHREPNDDNENALTQIETLLRQALDSPIIHPKNKQARWSSETKHFPITPQINIEADETGKYYLLSIIATDRNGLLHSIASVLSQYHIQLHTAKILTLGARIEDTFLISGRALSAENITIKLEQALVQVL